MKHVLSEEGIFVENNKKMTIAECVQAIDKYLNNNNADIPYVTVDVELLNTIRSYLLSYKLAQLKEAVEKENNTVKAKPISLNKKNKPEVKAVYVSASTADDDIAAIIAQLDKYFN